MADNPIFDNIDANPGFEDTPKTPTIIKVVGVGGGGNNAINHMYEQHIDGVSFVVLNTDRQALNTSPVPNRLLIGPETTHGLGAGNVPEVARAAAEESSADISALFDDETKMAFITAGMGGGTGTGAAPIVARIAQEKGILTIGIVTIPFLFEGQKKILKALAGADEMSKYVDALLIINNQRLIDIYPDLDFYNAFGKADDTLSMAARSISEIITKTGKINLDFEDVSTTLRKGGVAIISTGYGEGEERVTKAINNALESPLLKNRDVFGSRKLLVNIYYNPNASNPFMMSEMSELQAFMANFSPDLDVISGVSYDETLDDRIKITILAAGFNVSLEGDADPSVLQNKPKTAATATTTAPAYADESRLKDEYGDEAINKLNLEKAKAQYIILRPEDLDNDEIIELMEKSTTLKRKPEVRTQVREKQQGTVHVAAAPAAPRPAEPEKRKPSTGTINFDME